MKRVEEMPKDIDLFFFRKGEVPMWEENPTGGIWATKAGAKDNVSLMWESLLFGTIGEQFGDSSVMGVGLSNRYRDRLF